MQSFYEVVLSLLKSHASVTTWLHGIVCQCNVFTLTRHFHFRCVVHLVFSASCALKIGSQCDVIGCFTVTGVACHWADSAACSIVVNLRQTVDWTASVTCRILTYLEYCNKPRTCRYHSEPDTVNPTDNLTIETNSKCVTYWITPLTVILKARVDIRQ